jgi:hypothetical protein
MNVLLFVMTMLMLLALMTYSRLDVYRSSQMFQMVFKHYMETDERGHFNVKAKPMYDSIKVQTKAGKAGSKPAEGSPRIGIELLLDKSKREKQEKEWIQTRILLKNLINTLYEKQPFYKTALEKRPSLPDDLINSITAAIDDLDKDSKPKSAADLANLKLSDPELDQILYKILQGGAYKEIPPEKKKESVTSLETPEVVEAEADQSQADPSLKDEDKEFKSIEGYYSLLDFITAKKPPKVRVFLASREVLQSIFPNPETVNAILSERKQLYLQARADGDTKELADSFKNQFERYKDQSIDSASLSFDVSKTDPRKYE